MSRRSPAWSVRQRLSERDLAILTTLAHLRLMTGQHLRRTFFAGDNPITEARKSRAVLKRLYELRLLVRLTRRVGGLHAGSEGQVLGLSGLGHAVLDVGADVQRRHRPVSDTKLAFQAHVLAVSELYVQLVERSRRDDVELVDFQAEPACWRRFSGIGGQTIILKPDAFVCIGVGEFERLVFVEQDMATESLPTITRKLGVHIDYWHSGQELRLSDVQPQVWWLVPDTRRQAAIERIIHRLPVEAQRLFVVTLTDQAADLLTQPMEGGDQ